ncbi:RTG3 [Candida margitis]|uniref:RTG3 n=1 Tax=Candida margitis TaxID=1775924 RepID=UPI002225EFF4|nr:RTG3 [Candida margitis]KAI5968703.1 RTG3 [Candida margitis]
MEEFLKDSPSEIPTSEDKTNEGFNNNFVYTTLDNERLDNPQSLNLDFDPLSEGRQQQDYSLDLTNNYDENNYKNDASGNYFSSGSNVNTNTPGSGFNSNTQLSGSDYLSPMGFSYNQQGSQSQSQNPISNQQQPGHQRMNSDTFSGSNPGSFTSEPFLDDVAFSQAILGPQLNVSQYGSNQENLSPQQFSPQLQSTQPFVTNSANLDELISPGNNYDESTFLNPQYFSPPNRSGNHFNSLRSIAEDTFDANSADIYSPDLSRHGSISGPTYGQGSNIPQTGSYLSPQLDPVSYVSPDFNSGSYLNSPPQYNSRVNNLNLNVPAQNMSTSIPNHTTTQEKWNSLSPLPSQSSTLSTSVPNSKRDVSVPTKQLSKEEKLKRRREFHNAVERRRRDLIKERIKELGIIVPPSLLNPQLSAVQTLQQKNNINSSDLNDLISSIKVKETKPNKSTILNKSVEYINHLNYVLRQQELSRNQLCKQIKQLEQSNI